MSNEYGYGREEIALVTQESEFGTLVQPVAADAMKILSSSMAFSQERADRLEKGSTRSILTRKTRRKSVDWSLDKYILPSGAAGTAPDDALLWAALFGTQTIVTDTSVAYTLLAEPAISLDIFRSLGHFREVVTGAVPSKLAISFGGDDEPKVTFSGSGKDHLLCGTDTLDEAASSTTLTVHDARRFSVGMLIKVGDQDNSGAGYAITAIDYDDNELTVNASVTAADESLVTPLPITPTTAGSPIPLIVGSATVGGTTVYVTGGGFDIDQKVAMRNNEFGQAAARGYRHPDRRDVRCKLDLYFERGAAAWLNDAKRFTSQAVTVVLGDTAGSICTIAAPAVEFEIPSVEVPDTDECTISLTGPCLGSSGEDEITVTFT